MGGYAYLLALAEIFRMSHKTIWAWVLRALFLLGLGYLLFLVSVGVGGAYRDMRVTDVYFNKFGNVFGCEKVKSVPTARLTNVTDGSIRSAVKFATQLVGWQPNELLATSCLWAMKFATVGLTTYKYLFRFVLPLNSRIPEAIAQPNAAFFVLFAFLGFSILAFTLLCLFKHSLLGTVLLIYLPISGFIYFTWMSYSLVGDRLVYIPLAFFSLWFWRQISPWVNKWQWAKVVCLLWMGFLFYQSHQRASYLVKVYQVPFNCILCSPAP